jgi:hypothetical protein
MPFMKQYLLAFTLLFVGAVDLSAQRLACVATSTAQPFSLLWATVTLSSSSEIPTWLKLNTATGQIYQIQYPNGSAASQPTSPVQVAVNSTILSDGGVPGRFVLLMDGSASSGSTGSALLLDQQTGQTWLVAPPTTNKGNYTFTPIPGT